MRERDYPLDHDVREVLEHELIEIGVALGCLPADAGEELEGDGQFEETLLVVDVVPLAVEGHHVLQHVQVDDLIGHQGLSRA